MLEGVPVFRDAGTAILYFGSPDTATLANFGTIISGSTEQSIFLGTETNTVINHRSISNITPNSAFGAVFQLSGGNSSGGFFGAIQTIINHGDISGTNRLFDVDGLNGRFDLDLDNMGSMIGGDDVLNNTGTNNGDIDLSVGENLYVGTNTSPVGEITAGAGDDTVQTGTDRLP